MNSALKMVGENKENSNAQILENFILPRYNILICEYNYLALLISAFYGNFVYDL